MESKTILTQLKGLDVEQVISLLKSWSLDAIMADTFRRQHVDGDALACMETGDFDEADFPSARKFHWKKFWMKLEEAKQYGVPIPEASAPMERPATEETQNHKPWLLKTEICKVHARTGSCMYGENCRFAHGLLELRFVKRHPRYKTRKCVNFWNRGYCAYGDRCCFIHNEIPTPEMHAGRPLDHPAEPLPPPTMPQPQPTIAPPPESLWTEAKPPTHAIWADADPSANWRPPLAGANPWDDSWSKSTFPHSSAMPSVTPDMNALVTNFGDMSTRDEHYVPDALPEKTYAYAAGPPSAPNTSAS